MTGQTIVLRLCDICLTSEATTYVLNLLTCEECERRFWEDRSAK
jgi:hypothetical protein